MTQDEREMLLKKIAEANARLEATQRDLNNAKKKLNEYEEKAKKAEQASRMSARP